MKLPHGAWVVVADGAKALYLENTGDAELIDLRVRRHDEQETTSTHEQGSDRPGRKQDNGVGQKSALEHTDWHRIEETRFNETLAERLNRLVQKGRIGKMVLIADPRSLGRLRPLLSQATASAVLSEIPKDLAHQTVASIEKSVLAA
jgi:protein required for attachment to host cells